MQNGRVLLWHSNELNSFAHPLVVRSKAYTLVFLGNLKTLGKKVRSFSSVGTQKNLMSIKKVKLSLTRQQRRSLARNYNSSTIKSDKKE